MKTLMSGNEAIARGAWEAGIEVATAYPGTPSTEILQNVALYKDIYSEWSANEKVALDTERDYWLLAEEAKEYGIVDEILTRRELEAVASSS